MDLEFENLAASSPAWKSVLLAVAVGCTLFGGCRARQGHSGVRIEFTRVPFAEEGGPDRLDVIEGRVIGARPGQQIVLFARSGPWYVQPVTDQPFTPLQPDSTWRSTTHLGTEYAALLVEPGYQPPALTDVLPGAGGEVVAVVIRKGMPVFWQRWWFLLLCLLACMSALLAFYNYRLQRQTRQLHLRFEERLAERTQIAQELHDTLLQGVISASMQLHVAVDGLPEDLAAKPALTHVLQIMSQVLEEGRNALQRLRSPAGSGSLDVEQAFSRIRQEFAGEAPIGFRVVVEGRHRPVHPIIRDEVYRIGREVLVDAFRRSRARHINVVVKYKASHLRVVIQAEGGDEGGELDPRGPRSERDGQERLAGVRARAEGIGARLKIRKGAAAGTQIDLSVPGHVAFQGSPAKKLSQWFAGWSPRKAGRP